MITLQDCLDEFTKEEMLGQDDLWYCPGCKKHQQASKKFDLWGVPDVLVVHLKRFSSSRVLRDKIDELVEFPVEGLDLGGWAMERSVRRRLAEARGEAVAALAASFLEDYREARYRGGAVDPARMVEGVERLDAALRASTTSPRA